MTNKLAVYRSKIKHCNQLQSEIDLAVKSKLEQSILHWDGKNFAKTLLTHWFLSKPITKALNENKRSYKKERHKIKQRI